jgi:helix-turn-helix protein
MLRTMEPYHGWIYFVPEAREAYSALGVTGNRMGYFGSRSAAMGAVNAEVVISTFYNFHPDLVRRQIPAVWDITSPADLVRARLEAADAMLHRMLGDAVGSTEMKEAAELARQAAGQCRPEGRPLYAGHASLPWPDEPHLVLWHAQTLLREFRGDGHIAALTTANLDGCEALVTHAAAGDVGADVLQRSRAWSDDEWAAAVERLRSRGWVNGDGSFTQIGREHRDAIERSTDELAMAPWEALGEERCQHLRELVRPWSKTIVASGEISFDLDET